MIKNFINVKSLKLGFKKIGVFTKFTKKSKKVKFKKYNKKKNLLLLKKKNLLLKKKFRKIFKFKKYKILNLIFLNQKKQYYINFMNHFFDVFIWIFFVYFNKEIRYTLKPYRFFFKNKLNYNLKSKKKKDNNFLKLLLHIIVFAHAFCFLDIKFIHNIIFKTQKFILDDVKDNRYIMNRYFKDFSKKKNKKVNIKYLLLLKKKYNIYISKKFDFLDLRFFKKNFIFNKYYKNYYYDLEKKKIKKRISRRVKFFFKKILKRRSKKLTIFLKNRLFYYDFFFNKYEKNLYLLKKKTNVNILWQKILNNTFLRYRLSDYIFLLLLNLMNSKLLKNKFYYILNFYKIIIFLKKKISILKKYLIKKYLILNLLKKKRFNIKYLLKKEYLVQNIFLKKKIFIKNLLKYKNMLKYFNKLIFLIKKNLNYNITNIINNYSGYIYSSFLLNLNIPTFNNISLVSINNYFMQKSTKSYTTGWLINDRIFNFLNIYDITSKKSLYWNTIIPLPILAKRDIEKSYYMIPEVIKNYDLKYSYFVGKGKNSKLEYYKSYIYNIFLTFLRYIFYRWYYNFKKGFINDFLKKISINSLLIFKNYLFNFFIILKLKYLYNKNFIKYSLVNKNFNILNLKIRNLKNKKNKIYFLKILIFFILLNFNQRYFFWIKMKNRTKKLSFLNKYFKNFYKSNSFNLPLYNYLLYKNKNVFGGSIFNLNSKNYVFKKTFLSIIDNYYTMYSDKNKNNKKKCILHLVEKKTNNFLVLSLFDTRRVIGHTSAGQGLYRAYNNSKRQKKGTRVLGKILFRKLKLRARKFGLKEVFLKYNFYWNFRINFLTKYWVLRYKLGIPKLSGLKLGLGLPYHKGLRLSKKKRK